MGRFQWVDVRAASQQLAEPFQPLLLTDVDEFGCYLFRCEGEGALHCQPQHDVLFWPLDGTLVLREAAGQRDVPRGHLARVPRGWEHGTGARVPIHVILLRQAERGGTLNGHATRATPLPPQQAAPLAALAEAAANTPLPLLRCDGLRVGTEQVVGSGPARRASHDLLVAPLRGTVGLRCGGLVMTLGEWQMARVPAGASWNLFGNAPLLWLSKGEYA